MLADQIALLLACAAALALCDGWTLAAAGSMLISFVLVSGYEFMTGDAAVYGFYIIADIFCTVLLLGWLHIMGRTHATTAGALVLLGFLVCCMIDGLRLAGLWADVLSYWWVLRIVNLCQIIVLGSAACGGGKRNRRGRPDDRLWRGGVGGSALARELDER